MYRGERLNSISHLVGAAFAVAGAAVLITLAVLTGDWLRILSYTVYSITLVLLYLASTLYHSLRGRAKQVFRLLDHQAIYLLIAGTYTPFLLIAVQGTLGWWLFAGQWGLAAFGIVLEAVQRKERQIVALTIYLMMGWMGVFVLDPITAALPAHGFNWLIAGGLFYTFGVFFFVLDHRNSWFHGIWHLFVIAGSVSHYCAIILLY